MTADPRPVYIYALCEPGTHVVRYIGQTVNVENRLKQHMHTAPSGHTYKARWIKRVLSQGQTPALLVIDVVDSRDKDTAECYYIAKYREDGYRLTNLTKGGDGCLGRPVSEDTREKQRKANTGKTRSAETRARIGEASRKRVTSEETRKKCAEAAKLRGGLSSAGRDACIAANKRRQWTEASRKKAAESSRTASTGRRHSLETRQRQSEIHTGKTISAEQRAKTAATLTGRRASAETRAKLSALRKGKPWTAERRERWEQRRQRTAEMPNGAGVAL